MGKRILSGTGLDGIPRPAEFLNKPIFVAGETGLIGRIRQFVAAEPRKFLPQRPGTGNRVILKLPVNHLSLSVVSQNQRRIDFLGEICQRNRLPLIQRRAAHIIPWSRSGIALRELDLPRPQPSRWILQVQVHT